MKRYGWIVAVGLAAGTAGGAVYFGFYHGRSSEPPEALDQSPVMERQAQGGGSIEGQDGNQEENTGLYDSGPLILRDVYTSEEAAQRAMATRSPAASGASASSSAGFAPAPVSDYEEEDLLSEPLPGLFQLPSSSSAPPPAAASAAAPGLLSAEDQAREAEDPALMTPEAAEIIATVEGALRRAVMERNIQAFFSAVDEGIQYSYDPGTPDMPDDDMLRQGNDFYRDIVLNRLFRPDTEQAVVELSPPRNFQLNGDAAIITYDYSMEFLGRAGRNQVGGTSDIYLMRGGLEGESDGWRIVNWADSPFRPPADEDEDR